MQELYLEIGEDMVKILALVVITEYFVTRSEALICNKTVIIVQ